MIPFGYEIVNSAIALMKDFFIDGIISQMFVFPIDPSNTLIGDLYGDEYDSWPTKYIGGIDGDVLLSKTVKSNF